MTFYKVDVTNEEAVDRLFSKHHFDGVIHFAGLKAVGESVEKPLLYYYNNTVSTMVLIKACIKYKVNNLCLVHQLRCMVKTKSPLWKLWNCCRLRTLMVKPRP